MNKRLNKQDTIFILVLLFTSVFLVWKAHQGYIFNDEPFMVSLGHRIIKGDKLFVDEWNMAQTTGLFYAPFIWFFTAITNSTEGIIIFCRLVYVVWWLFVGIVVYKRLKQYGWASIIVVAMFLLYTPLDEMSLTYNVLALSFIYLFITYFLAEGKKLSDYLNGVVLALAVLAYPTLIVLYFVYLLFVIAKNLFKISANSRITSMLSWKVFLRITISASVMASLFLCFVFTGGIQKVIDSIFLIFSFSSGNKPTIFKLIRSLWRTFHLQAKWGSLVFVVSIIDRYRNKRSFVYFIVQLALFAITIVSLIINNVYSFNIIIIPLAFLGLQAFVLLKNKDYSLLVLVACGLVYALCGWFSSDTGLFAFSNGFVLVNTASVIYTFRYLYDCYSDKNNQLYHKALIAVMAITVFLQVGSELYIKVVRSYWDKLYPALNTEIKVGAAKGIITTDANAEYYESVYEDVIKIQEYTNNNKELFFLSTSLFPSIYLDLDYNYGTYSAWSYSNNKLNYEVLNNKLATFYEKKLNKIPDIVYVSLNDEEFINMITCIDFSAMQEIDLKTGKAYIKK